MSIYDISEIPYNERNYFGYCNKVDTCRTTIVYYGDEVYKRHPLYTNLIVGNFGTIINEANLGYKLIPFINEDGHVCVRCMCFTNDGRRLSKTLTVCLAVLLAHDYRSDYRSYKVIHLNGNKMQNVFYPESKFHNLKWATMAEFNRHKEFIAELNKKG